ncbi:unnamed protein product, partial [Prorocentrum cordatum]
MRQRAAADEQEGAAQRAELEEGRAPRAALEELDLERQVEEERRERVQELERRELEAAERLRREERARREEEDQTREQIRMHSEEMLEREFCRLLRRERRALEAEDRRAARLRDGQRAAEERAARDREAIERAAMSREEALASRVREREREVLEAAALLAQDLESASWRDRVRAEEQRCWEEQRLREDRRRMALGDDQSRRWEDNARALYEARRMATEDTHSLALRHIEPEAAVRRRRLALDAASDLHFDSLPVSAAPPGSKPAGLLAALLRPGQKAAAAAAGAGPQVEPRTGDGGPGPPEAHRLDPWAGTAASRVDRAAAGRGRRGRAPLLRSLGGMSVELVPPLLECCAASGHRPDSLREDCASCRAYRQARRDHDFALSALEAANAATATPSSSSASGAAQRGGGPPAGAGSAGACGGELCRCLAEDAVRWGGGSLQARRRGPAEAAAAAPRARWPRGEPLRAAAVLPGVEAGELLDGMPAGDLVRLELRMESLEDIPALGCAPELRILLLTGNRLRDLAPLVHCPRLEELSLCQNSLTSLRGVQGLSRLVVLKATMNELTDASDLSGLRALRHVELSKNRLEEVQLRAPGLARLVLCRNALSSAEFLEHLPSLTELDLGRNRITSLDSRVSEWNPLLIKLFLYENRIGALPKFRLPLLTDLWLDGNSLEALGPLGFLPSLERLQANNNQIRALASPIAASPLLQALQLAFNQLGPSEPPRAVPLHPRLRHLQLNDNPVASELMEAYRPWALRLAPQLEELDNEPVTEGERLTAVAAQAAADPSLPHCLAAAAAAGGGLPTAPLAEGRSAAAPAAARRGAEGAGGLLGLVAAASVAGGSPAAGAGEEWAPSAGSAAPVRRGAAPSGLDARGVMGVQRAACLGRWRAAASGGHAGEGGCEMCRLTAWCGAAASSRNAALVANSREERRSTTPAAAGSGVLREEALLVLRRRRDFWASFLDACGSHYDALSPWRGAGHPGAGVCRLGAFEVPGAERSMHQVALLLQARRRGALGRRRAADRRLRRRCASLSDAHVKQLTSVQARWRGARARSRLRACGAPLPGDEWRATRARAAAKLQAAARGWRTRRALRRAREAARAAAAAEDDLEEMPEIDLGWAEDAADMADPFALHLPSPSAARALLPRAPPAPAQPQGAAGAAGARDLLQRLPADGPAGAAGAGGAPAMAWGTPPGSASNPPAGQRHSRPASPSLAGSPGSSRSGAEPLRRARSLCSTAESARPVTPDGHRHVSRVVQVREEWGFTDDETARRFLQAKGHRQQRPP